MEFVSASSCKDVTPGEGKLAECISEVMEEVETGDPADAKEAGTWWRQGTGIGVLAGKHSTRLAPKHSRDNIQRHVLPSPEGKQLHVQETEMRCREHRQQWL